MGNSYNSEALFIGFEKCSKLYKKICGQAVKEYNFSPNEIDVIMFLVNNPTLNTASDICRYKKISKALVCRSVESLTKRKMIVQEVDKQDRRQVHLQLTDITSDIAERIIQCRKDFMKQLTVGIDSKEIEVFLGVLSKMIDNIDEIFTDREKVL